METLTLNVATLSHLLRSPELTDGDRVLYLYLVATRDRSNWSVDTSRTRLAEALGKSPTSIAKGISQLITTGFIAQPEQDGQAYLPYFCHGTQETLHVVDGNELSYWLSGLAGMIPSRPEEPGPRMLKIGTVRDGQWELEAYQDSEVGDVVSAGDWGDVLSAVGGSLRDAWVESSEGMVVSASWVAEQVKGGHE